MPGSRLAEGRIRGVCHPDVFLDDVSGIFVGQMVIVGDGAPATNQHYHEDHFGSSNSVGRPRLPLLRAWLAAMVGIMIFEISSICVGQGESGYVSDVKSLLGGGAAAAPE